MEADGAPFTSSLCQCSILRIFKATATQIREKSEQTLESLRIELGTSSTEGSTLTNSVTRLLLKCILYVKDQQMQMNLLQKTSQLNNSFKSPVTMVTTSNQQQQSSPEKQFDYKPVFQKF